MDVIIKGFKTKEQAKAFLEWYEGGGEQYFSDHLDIMELNYKDGCYIDCHRGPYEETKDSIIAYVK